MSKHLEKIYLQPNFWKAIISIFPQLKAEHNYLRSAKYSDDIQSIQKSYHIWYVNGFQVSLKNQKLEVTYEDPDNKINYPICDIVKNENINTLVIHNIPDVKLWFDIKDEIKIAYTKLNETQCRYDWCYVDLHSIYGKEEITRITSDRTYSLKINSSIYWTHDIKNLGGAINDLSIALQKRKKLNEFINSIKIPVEVINASKCF